MIRSERKNVIQTVGTRVDVLQAGTLELYKRMLTAFYVEDGMKIFVRQGKFMRPPCPHWRHGTAGYARQRRAADQGARRMHKIDACLR